MSPDHYAILGVARTAPPAVIRAAYLALMREYHPDRNPSPSAAGRAQAIVEAYKVLGDFDRRQEYDWGRRREREAAAALAAKPKRRVPAGVVAAGAIGLTAVGAMMLRPGAPPETVPAPRAVIVDAKPKSVPSQRAKRVVVVARAKPAPIKPRAEPVRVAAAEPEMPKPVQKERPRERAPARVAAVEPVRPKVKVAMDEPVRPKPKLAVVAMPPPKPVAAAGTDLASLDQFVMSFYGQSWRFGDASKRAALQQSRDGFVVRRGACLADSCKRAAYLKLMRDVSTIVESGQPAR